MSNETLMMVAVVVIAAVVIAAVAWMLVRRRKTSALRARFGPEYDHVLHAARTPAEAERELQNRQRRVESCSLRERTGWRRIWRWTVGWPMPAHSLSVRTRHDDEAGQLTLSRSRCCDRNAISS